MGIYSFDDDDHSYKTTTYESHYEYSGSYTMNWLVAVLVVVGAVAVLVLLCRCCCGGKTRGRVLAPPTDNSTTQPAAYPQQQYAAPYLAAVPAHAHAAPAPAGPYYAPAPYPTHHVLPLHAPPIIAPGTIPAPYPQQHYFYAEAVSPYPPAVSAPYPTHAAAYPHPQPQPQHHAHPQPAHAPTVTSTDPSPPSYDQVMGACEGKQPPYNPNVMH